MNTCQNCKKARATVHLTEIDPENAQPQETHLCEACARESGASTAKPALSTLSLTTTLMSLQEKVAKTRGGMSRAVTCDECGMTYQEFRVKGRLGCCRCYEAFEEGLAPLLEKVHGSSHYVGPSPGVGTQRERVSAAHEQELLEQQRRLTRLVKDEDYEEAARVRDRIRELETLLSHSPRESDPERIVEDLGGPDA